MGGRKTFDADVFAGEHAALNFAFEQVHRRIADEARDEGVGGVVVDLGRGTDLLHDALVHHHDAICQRHRLDLVVGDVDRGDFQLVAEVFDLGAGGDAELGVEVGERLVHQEHVRFAHDGAGEGDALALAAGKLGRAAVQEVVKLHHRGGAADFRIMRFGVDAADLEGKADVFVDVHIGVERIALEHHGDIAVFRIEVIDPLAIDENIAFCGLLETGDHAHGRRLATAGGAEQNEELFIGNREVEIIDANERPPALGDIAELNFGHSTTHPIAYECKNSRRDSWRFASIILKDIFDLSKLGACVVGDCRGYYCKRMQAFRFGCRACCAA